MDGSAWVDEEEGGLCISLFCGVRRPTTPGPVYGLVAERARLVENKKRKPSISNFLKCFTENNTFI